MNSSLVVYALRPSGSALRYVCLLLLLSWQSGQLQEGRAQSVSYIGFSVGVGFTNQVYRNIPGYIINSLRQDTLRTSSGGGYSRKGIAFSLFYESAFSPRGSLILGAGFAQRGFQAESRLNPSTGVISPLEDNRTENNRLDYLSGEVALKYRFTRETKLIPYLGIGNRLLCLIGLNTPFWGTKSDKYGNYSQFEYAPLLLGGFELPLKGMMLRKRLSQTAVLDYNRLLLEVEYSPGVMNVHSAKRGYQPGQIGRTPLQVQRTVYNRALTLKVGIRI